MDQRNYVFVIDKSASMQGLLSETAADMLQGALKKVRRKDTFNIVRYDTEAEVLSAEPIRGTWRLKREALKEVKNTETRYGTSFDRAMELVEMIRQNTDGHFLIIVISDGMFGWRKTKDDFGKFLDQKISSLN